jgi:NAD(P)-dependent dehydrogenase (short-subunit alcohol dehydrogenase family)
MQLEGCRAIVAGGARGIGAAVVRAFVQNGARVWILDVNDAAGEALARDCSASASVAAQYRRCDVGDRAEVTRVFGEAAGQMGGLDVLVNAAAIQPAWLLAEDLTDDVWDKVFRINMKGTLYTNQAACKSMRAQGYGKIINFASAAGVLGAPGLGPYASSKGAVLAWTRTVAKEWGRHGIRVNVINPYVQTQMRGDGLSNTAFEPDGPIPKHWAPSDKGDERALLVRGKGGLKGDADADLAPVAVFLASRGSDFMTGQMFQVDGGLLLDR